MNCDKRARSARLSLLLALQGGMPSAGCSYLFVRPPRDTELGSRVIECTTSPAAPLIDSILVATNVGSAVYVEGQNNVKNKAEAVSFGLGVATFWLSSAIYGFYFTRECAVLKEEAQAGPYYLRPVRTRRGPPYPPRPVPPVGGSAPPGDSSPAAPSSPPPANTTPATRQQLDDDEPDDRSAPPSTSHPKDQSQL